MIILPINFSVSPRRRLVRLVCIVIGMILIVFGFLRSLDSGTGRTLWVIDNSLSMAVADIHTKSGVMLSRLDFAKKLMAENAVNIVGEQAVMSAAYGAKLELPMTDNQSAFLNVIHGINVLAQGGGSTVSSPVETIRILYGKVHNLHIIWITDGEFSDSYATLSGFVSTPKISFVGVGSRSGGPILEGYALDGHPRYKESGGQLVNSIRDDLKLQAIASSLNASLILLDTDKGEKNLIIPSQKMNSTNEYLGFTIVGILCVLFGLMFSRYHYFFNRTHGN